MIDWTVELDNLGIIARGIRQTADELQDAYQTQDAAATLKASLRFRQNLQAIFTHLPGRYARYGMRLSESRCNAWAARSDKATDRKAEAVRLYADITASQPGWTDRQIHADIADKLGIRPRTVRSYL